MKTYKIIVAYDGKRYHGWQIQPNDITIAQKLQDSFRSAFKKDIKIIGASRTDSGVHALGQVAKFQINFNINPNILLKSWNSILPQDILIRSLNHVDNNFHPQASVKEKTYYYNFCLKKPNPLISNYVYWIKQYRDNLIDLDKLNNALQVFIGTQDFRSFCTGQEHKSTIKTIDSIKLVYLKRYQIYQIQFKGQSFLRYMIRRIAGACLYAANSSKINVQNLKIALKNKDPEQNLLTAPANGLILRKIIYY